MADENTTPAVNDVKIDESSIAHPDPDRRGSLEKQLLQRPGKAELIESKQKPSSLPVLTFYPLLLLTCLPLSPPLAENILPASSAAPGLLAQQKEVSRTGTPCLLFVSPSGQPRLTRRLLCYVYTASETYASRLSEREDRPPPFTRRPDQEGSPQPGRGPEIPRGEV